MEEYEDMEGDAFDTLNKCDAVDATVTTREDLSQLRQRVYQVGVRAGKNQLVSVMSWIHVTSHVMDLTWLGQFHTITHLAYPEVDLVISHLTYLTFQINLSNQPFESIYAINLLIKSAAPLACGTSLPLTNICT